MCVIIGSNRPVRAATVNGSLDFAVISSGSSERLTERTELLYSPDVKAMQKSNNLAKRTCASCSRCTLENSISVLVHLTGKDSEKYV